SFDLYSIPTRRSSDLRKTFARAGFPGSKRLPESIHSDPFREPFAQPFRQRNGCPFTLMDLLHVSTFHRRYRLVRKLFQHAFLITVRLWLPGGFSFSQQRLDLLLCLSHTFGSYDLNPSVRNADLNQVSLYHQGDRTALCSLR